MTSRPLRAEWKGIRPDYSAQYWLLFVRILNCRPRPVKSLSDKWLECRYKPQKSERGATIPKWFARVVMMGKYFLWLPQLWTRGSPRHWHRVVERFLSWLMLPQFDMKTIRSSAARGSCTCCIEIDGGWEQRRRKYNINTIIISSGRGHCSSLLLSLSCGGGCVVWMIMN